MADAELTSTYQRILTAGFRAAAGAPVAQELEDSALSSVESTAERLATQLEASVIDAPWLRKDLLDIIGDWLGQPGELDFTDLRNSLEPLFGPSRALMIARSETAGAFNGAMAAGLRAHGWSHVVWISGPNACEDCEALDGQVMSIGDYENEPYLHPNCVCGCEPWEGDQAEDDESDAEETGDLEEYGAARRTKLPKLIKPHKPKKPKKPHAAKPHKPHKPRAPKPHKPKAPHPGKAPGGGGGVAPAPEPISPPPAGAGDTAPNQQPPDGGGGGVGNEPRDPHGRWTS